MARALPTPGSDGWTCTFAFDEAGNPQLETDGTPTVAWFGPGGRRIESGIALTEREAWAIGAALGGGPTLRGWRAFAQVVAHHGLMLVPTLVPQASASRRRRGRRRRSSAGRRARSPGRRSADDEPPLAPVRALESSDSRTNSEVSGDRVDRGAGG